MNNKFLLILPVIIIAIIGFFVEEEPEPPGFFQINKEILSKLPPPIALKYTALKDTIYLLGNNYVEISLTKQTATLVRRNDTPLVFRVSSGNSNLTKGMDTPEGIYTIQSKSPIATSKQFENAKLFNWIGFKGNIGFHGLEGSGYYRTLGIKPSSHGCVRISREDGEKLYKNVRIGTPVIVVRENPARVFRFASEKEFRINYDVYLKSNFGKFSMIMIKRLNNLYKGKANINNYNKIFMDCRTALRPGGYETGFAEQIPSCQELPNNYKEISIANPDNTQYCYFNIDTMRFSSKKKTTHQQTSAK
ncbi:MAG: hypothetical protein HW421_1872 [Ignavibacteria bacterium]|nr:hypothetical protein [Ignavibacteria bacterium]